MLISLSFDNINTVIVDHTNIMVEVQHTISENMKDEWWIGIYIHDSVEKREEPVNKHERRSSFALSTRRLLHRQKCKTLEESTQYTDKIKEYVNKQLESNSVKQVINQERNLGNIETLLDQNNMLIEKLTALLTPKPKAPRKTKEKKEEAK